MDVAAHYRSLTKELESLKDRVRNYIDDNHWLTVGEWRESVLRSIISQHLPDTVKIGRGFVFTNTGPTTQCDILLYRADAPVLFREGDFVFITADAVLGIIEVKSKATKSAFRKAVKKLAAIANKLGPHSEKCCLGLFAYETAFTDHDEILRTVQESFRRPSQFLNFVNLGCSTFVRWWKTSPHDSDEPYYHWQAYSLQDMSAGYFIMNVLDAVSPDIGRNQRYWFPEPTKELHLKAKRPHLAYPSNVQ
jgi:hypothetical protein